MVDWERLDLCEKSIIFAHKRRTIIPIYCAPHRTECSAVQYSIVQCSTVLYSTVQYSTIQYSTIQYNTIQYSTIQYNTIQYNTIQYNTIQYNTTQRNTILVHLLTSFRLTFSIIFYFLSGYFTGKVGSAGVDPMAQKIAQTAQLVEMNLR